MAKLLAHGATDVGRKRDHNEDRIFVDGELGLYLVCDGMGGHAAGEVAAQMVIDVVREAMVKACSEPAADDPEAEGNRLGDALEAAFVEANEAVHRHGQEQALARGMGTTATGVVVHGSHATVCHVGDSRCYLVRDGKLYQLTDDHSWVAEMVRMGRMTAAEAMRSPQRNLLVRSVGTQPIVKVDRLPIELVDGDTLLLCSDGLHGYFSTPSELVETVGRGQVEQLPKDLISLACARGGHDNISAIVLRAHPSDGSGVSNRDPRQELALLGRLEMFAQLELAELVRIRGASSCIHYNDMEYVTRIGDKGDALYVLVSGKAMVSAHGELLTTLHPGGHVGEMAMVDAQPRSASVQSLGESRWLRLARQDMFRIIRRHPGLAVKLLWNLARVLSDRLRSTNTCLQARGAELRAANEQLMRMEVNAQALVLEDPDGLLLVDEEDDVVLEQTAGGSIDIIFDVGEG